MRQANASAPSGSAQITNCGESTLPKSAKASVAGEARQHELPRRRGRPGPPAAPRGPTSTPANSAATAPSASCRRPSDRWLDTLTASPMPDGVERRAATSRRRALDLHGPVEVVARRHPRRRRATRRRRPSATTAIVAAHASAALPRLAAAAARRPATRAPPARPRAGTASSSPRGRARPGRHAAGRGTGAAARRAGWRRGRRRSGCAPARRRRSGIRAAANMARRGSPPVARASAPQSSTTAAAPASVQTANAQRKLSSPVPSRPGSAISGAASGGYSKAKSRYGSPPSSSGSAKPRYTNRSFTRSSRPWRHPERERPAGHEQARAPAAPHASTGSRSAARSAAGSRSVRA